MMESSHIEERRSGDLTAHTVHDPSTSTSKAKFGRMVFLDDIAHKTYVVSNSPQMILHCLTQDARRWKAFIYYAYLGEKELSFAPLRSEPKNATSEPNTANKALGLCSPKSMYRLAEKVHIAECVSCGLY